MGSAGGCLLGAAAALPAAASDRAAAGSSGAFSGALFAIAVDAAAASTSGSATCTVAHAQQLQLQGWRQSQLWTAELGSRAMLLLRARRLFTGEATLTARDDG